jgi:HK97 family phage major capsid protein
MGPMAAPERKMKMLYRAVRSFVTDDGEEIYGGATHFTRVAEGHELLSRYPEHFRPDPTAAAGARSEIRAFDPHSQRIVSGDEWAYWLGRAEARGEGSNELERLERCARDPARHEAGAAFGPAPRSLSGPEAARDQALRAIERHADALQPEAGDRLVRLVDRRDPLGIDARYLAAVADPAYHSAFGKLITDPRHGHLRHTPEEVEAMRAVAAVQVERGMVEGTGSAGGFAIPFTLDPSILNSSNGALNPVRQIARQITIATREWRGVSSDGVSASYDAEASEVSDDTPTLAQPSITTAMGRAFVPFSIELGQDWASLQSELAGLISDGRDQLDAVKFLTGSGTDEPAGVLTGLTTSQRVQTAGTASFALGDNYLLKESLGARFVARASFCANPTTLDTIYRFVGGGSTEPPVLPQRDGQWLGVPTYEWSAMASGSSTGTKLAVYGDFSQFVIADRVGMTVEIVQHLFGSNRRPTGERGVFAYWRTGSKVVVPNAFRYLEVK